jgi:hypothetical protein
MEPREHHPRRAFVFNRTGAAPTHLMAWCRRSRRGRRTRQRHRRVPQELGTPGGSLSTRTGTGRPDPNTPGPRPASGRRERRTQAHGRVPPREAHAKRGGMACRESERPIVPTRPGNSPREDPAEGRGRRVAELLGGNMAGTQRPGPVSTKQQQLARIAHRASGSSGEVLCEGCVPALRVRVVGSAAVDAIATAVPAAVFPARRGRRPLAAGAGASCAAWSLCSDGPPNYPVGTCRTNPCTAASTRAHSSR